MKDGTIVVLAFFVAFVFSLWITFAYTADVLRIAIATDNGYVERFNANGFKLWTRKDEVPGSDDVKK